MPEPKKLFLVDGHALVYRAFYAMISRPLRTSRGENTSAPWGVTQFIRKVLSEYEPDYLGFVFDAGGEDTFRHELYEDYKATREKLDETLQRDFDTAMKRVRQILEGYRIPVIELEGFEADDVIGTVAEQAVERGLQAVIVSGDKDFYQLIGDGVALLNPGRGGRASIEAEWVDDRNAAERLGVAPEQVTDYLALIGDSSDNIPGVRGIGPKTAAKLLEKYGSLEEILEHTEEISHKRPREALKKHEDEARLSKRLVTIRKDLPIDLDLEALKVVEPRAEELRDLFLELEFHSLVHEMAAEAEPEQVAEREVECELVTHVDDLEERVARASTAESCALELVLDGHDPLRAELVGLAIAPEGGEAFYLPLGHAPGGVPDGELPLDRSAGDGERNLPDLSSDTMRPLVEMLGAPESPKLGHDLKRTLLALRRAGAELGGELQDIMVASYCLDPGRRQHDLATLAVEHFGRTAPDYDDAGEGAPGGAPPEEIAAIAGERAHLALRLEQRLSEELDSYGLRKLYDEIEMPLLPVLADMEEAGIAIDRDFFAERSQRLQRELQLVEEEIFKLSGKEFNLNSPIQLREVLFEELELPVKKRTKTGPSTDADVLEELAAEGHQIPRLLLEYRELAKLKSTYIDALPALVHPETGRLHTSFNQTVASTGRLSSSDPNLQNIPIRTPLGASIRKGFVPAKGDVFLCADYSQIELRILAHLSGDPVFIAAFRKGHDIHRDTAALIFGVDGDAVTGAMRGQAKTVNFATIYGQGPAALARQLGISVTQARSFIEGYFERFPAIRGYLDRQVELAKEQGYVETLLGRRRYIPELQSKNPNIRAFGERVATNSPIQGAAADLIKMAMIRIHRRLEDYRARMLLQVHDELLLELPPDESAQVSELVRSQMEGVIDLEVPISVDMGSGASWYEAKPD